MAAAGPASPESDSPSVGFRDNRPRMRSVLLIASLTLVALPAAAEIRLPRPTAPAPAVRLLDGWRQPDGSRMAAIEIRLAPGWHTYWRVPGEAGIPPSFDWSGSGNLASVSYEWPRPDIIESFGMRSYGYVGLLILPVRLVPKNPDAPIDVVLALDYGVCDDICVPAEASVDETVPATAEEGRPSIEAALAERPQSPEEAGVDAVTCSLSPVRGGFALTAAVTFAAPPGPDQEAVVEAGQPDLWVGLAESRTEGRTVTTRVPVASAVTAASGAAAGPIIARDQLRVTVIDDDRAVEIRGCRAP